MFNPVRLEGILQREPFVPYVFREISPFVFYLHLSQQ